MTRLRDDWEQTKVGCYFTRGDYTISTFYEVCGGKVTRCGYRLFHKKIALEDFSLLTDAQLAAEDHEAAQSNVG